MNELSEISALVKEYISPETVWLVPCLYALGSIIKRSIRHRRHPDTGHPVPGGGAAVGAGECGCLRAGRLDAVGDSGGGEHRTGVCAGGGCAICLNQLIKQHGRAGALKKGFDGKEEENETGN